MNQLITLQQKADEYLIVGPSALQLLLLIQLNACRLHQSVLAAVDTCGCISPANDNTGELCPACRDEICIHLGALLFYAAALSSALNLHLSDICDLEIDKLDLLGYFLV